MNKTTNFSRTSSAVFAFKILIPQLETTQIRQKFSRQATVIMTHNDNLHHSRQNLRNQTNMREIQQAKTRKKMVICYYHLLKVG